MIFYILKNTNDPKSYESVEFSKLSFYVVPFDSSDNFPKQLSDTLDLSVKEMTLSASLAAYSAFVKPPNYIIESIKEAQIELDSVRFTLDSINTEIRIFKEKYDKNPTRKYVVVHKFRAKNAVGGLVLNDVKFSLDTNLTKVLSAN